MSNLFSTCLQAGVHRCRRLLQAGLSSALHRLVLALVVVCAPNASVAWTVSTLAGGPPGTHSNVEQHRIGIVMHAVADGRGSLFVTDPTNDRVLRYNLLTGMLSVYAGLGIKGFYGDGGPASEALLDYPTALAVDINGNLYISDTGNRRVRKVEAATGNISTIAGSGYNEHSGDGGQAVAAGIRSPGGLALDPAGFLYVAESERDRIRKVNLATGIITTFAGGNFVAAIGDGGPALSARLKGPTALLFDPASGALHVSDTLHGRVRRTSWT